jgi:hypothetical protein
MFLIFTINTLQFLLDMAKGNRENIFKEAMFSFSGVYGLQNENY